MKDRQTLEYFDRFTPHYDPARFEFAIAYLNKTANGESSLIDIGCGDGATLYLVWAKTPVKRLVGMDISRSYLQKAQERVGCQIIEGSILDRGLIDRYAERFDYCTLGAVLHHLIGKNRRQSFAYASLCLAHSFRLLKPEGSLLIFEPTFAPSFMMDLVFWIKKIVGNCTSNRIELFSTWANFGRPVVSYLTLEQLTSTVEHLQNADVLESNVVDRAILGGIIRRTGVGIIVRKTR